MTNQQGAPEALTDFERRHAIRQGYEIAASDGYFEARPQIDSNDRRKAFQAGFERGWDRHAALVEAQQPAPSAAAADTVVLEAALRAIHQAIDLIGEPDTERLRTVRRVLRGAVVVAEDSNAPQADTQPAQHGVSYAALPESFLEIPDVQDESGINAYYSREVVLECIDAALASHGQAPAHTPADSVLEDAEIDRIVPALEPVSEDFPAEWAVWKDRERIREELRAARKQGVILLT